MSVGQKISDIRRAFLNLLITSFWNFQDTQVSKNNDFFSKIDRIRRKLRKNEVFQLSCRLNHDRNSEKKIQNQLMWLKIQLNYRNTNFKFFQRDFGEQNVKKYRQNHRFVSEFHVSVFIKKMSVGQKISEFRKFQDTFRFRTPPV